MSMLMIYLMLVLSILILSVSFMLSKKMFLDLEKNSSFECGFNSLYKTRLPFSSHFFLIALIFIIFDLELIILVPLPLVTGYSLSMVISLIVFIFFLIFGLFHEWNQGSLSWV